MARHGLDAIEDALVRVGARGYEWWEDDSRTVEPGGQFTSYTGGFNVVHETRREPVICSCGGAAIRVYYDDGSSELQSHSDSAFGSDVPCIHGSGM